MDKFLMLIILTCIVSVQPGHGLSCYSCYSTNHNCEGTSLKSTCPPGYNACYVARSSITQKYMEIRDCGFKDLCQPDTTHSNYSQTLTNLLAEDNYNVVAVCDTDYCNGGIEDNCNDGNGGSGIKGSIVTMTTFLAAAFIIIQNIFF